MTTIKQETNTVINLKNNKVFVQSDAFHGRLVLKNCTDLEVAEVNRGDLLINGLTPCDAVISAFEEQVIMVQVHTQLGIFKTQMYVVRGGVLKKLEKLEDVVGAFCQNIGFITEQAANCVSHMQAVKIEAEKQRKEVKTLARKILKASKA